MNIHVNELHGVGIRDIIVIFFHLVSNVFFTTLGIRLDFSHPLILGVSHYICSQPLDTTRIHLLHCVHGWKGWSCMMLREMLLQPLQKMRDFTFRKIKPMSFHPLPYSCHNIELLLCY
jgi:hypothetical protein